MNSVDWSGTMFSAQARTGIPLVKTDVNRTMETLQEKAVEQNWGVGGGEQGGKGWEERQIKKKNTDWGSSTLCSVQKNWLMNKIRLWS